MTRAALGAKIARVTSGSKRGRVRAVAVLAAIAVFGLAATADADFFRGTSHPHNVKVKLWTNPQGKPYSVRFSHYHVPCTNGYRLGFAVSGESPPWDAVSPNRIFDHWVNRTHRRTRHVVIDFRAKRRGDTWRGRFRGRWAYRHRDGDVYTRCHIHFRFAAKRAR